jgi:tripartite-type tricarboxylate transporter receptor subunit TctC
MLPMVFSAAPGFQASSIQELIRLAKASPNSVNVALPSTSAQVELEQFKHLAGIELFGVNYKGSGAAFTDLFGGRVQIMIDTVTASLPQISGGKMKPLAISTARRFEAVPAIPTMIESGVPGFDLAPWNALFAPHGTPAAVISLLNAEVAAILAEPETRQRLVQIGIDPAGGSPEQLAAFVRSETQKWGDLVRKANIKAD